MKGNKNSRPAWPNTMRLDDIHHIIKQPYLGCCDRLGLLRKCFAYKVIAIKEVRLGYCGHGCRVNTVPTLPKIKINQTTTRHQPWMTLHINDVFRCCSAGFVSNWSLKSSVFIFLPSISTAVGIVRRRRRRRHVLVTIFSPPRRRQENWIKIVLKMMIVWNKKTRCRGARGGYFSEDVSWRA